MKNKCVLCKGNLKKKVIDYKIYGRDIGKYPALVCESCGEQWFDEETSKEIEKKETKVVLYPEDKNKLCVSLK